ncbi:MAG: hypothetical protein CVV47_08850 [Spirochaetae bacterium HGW-Spirochaetae-3]|jgi:cytochrome c biogenesis protein CcdA|nr:MAG: hypothetical protein CVV47_08850 [Spirochaetae bacterium HGW-Spirochaetae-3]
MNRRPFIARQEILAVSLVLFSALAAVWAGPNQRPPARAEYYGELGCAHCDTFVDKELPSAEAASGVRVELEAFDILSEAGYARCEARVEALGYSFRVFPVLVIGQSVYQGNAAIEANLAAELRSYAETGSFLPRFDDATEKVEPTRWSAPAIIAAGLVDGVNPCAFTTLLFFMSYLSLRGGTKRRMAAAGLVFAAGIFAAYFLIGFGLFNAFRLGGRLQAFRLALKIAMSAITVVFCLFTVRDILSLRNGKSADISLKLPERLRLGINAAIRKGAGSAAFLAGVFVAGVVVSVLELACTGQVYFPAISIMVQSDASWRGIGNLALYNLAFVLPLLSILGLSLLGMRQEALRAFFTRHLAASKAAQALLFAALAILVWVV